MKYRNFFISNSSSASFCISLDDLSAKQLRAILAYENYSMSEQHDSWDINLNGGFVKGFTIMDNGDLSRYFELQNIPMSIVNWNDECL